MKRVFSFASVGSSHNFSQHFSSKTFIYLSIFESSFGPDDLFFVYSSMGSNVRIKSSNLRIYCCYMQFPPFSLFPKKQTSWKYQKICPSQKLVTSKPNWSNYTTVALTRTKQLMYMEYWYVAICLSDFENSKIKTQLLKWY